MKRLQISAILILISSLLSCPLPTNINKQSIILSQTTDSLIIDNQAMVKIYVFVVEWGFAQFIDWIPTFYNRPYINHEKSLEFKFNDIPN